ncbi:hypothetical protein [Actinocorallia libanotica]|uniref:Uncharacterized protein n=1 Tax=Actinocorallia libanotica TaxID=46162 RepID=A0ABP4CCG6_9ACTN
MTDDFNPIEHASRSAEQALNAHERTSTGSTPAPADEPWWRQARLTTLLRDLAHYADAHDLDFDDALREARTWHRTDLAEQIRYRPGDEVAIYDTPHQGIITAITSSRGTQRYEVRIIGKPDRRLLTSADLAPAFAFPALTIDGFRLLTAAAAEQAFRHNIARTLQAPTPECTRNCHRLADALSTWSGVPRDELYLNVQRAASPHPAHLARQSYPEPNIDPTPTAVHHIPPAVRATLKGPTR